MTIAIISVCSVISCQCTHLRVIEGINWLIIFAVRKGNKITFNIVKIHFSLKTQSLPMQQSVTNLWEDFKIQVFGFFVEFLVVWVFLCVEGEWLFLCLVWGFGSFWGWGRGCGYLLKNYFEEIPQTENRQVFKKQSLSHFCLLVWAFRLCRSWIIPQFWWLLWPPILSDCFSPDRNPESLRSLIPCTHHKHGTGKCIIFRHQWIPHSLKTIFPCCDPPSLLFSKTVFNSETFCFLQICRGRERKCLLIVILRCSNFN